MKKFLTVISSFWRHHKGNSKMGIHFRKLGWEHNYLFDDFKNLQMRATFQNQSPWSHQYLLFFQLALTKAKLNIMDNQLKFCHP